MPKFTLIATRTDGIVATRRTDRDYSFAVVRQDGSASFHFEYNSAVAAANRFGGEIVRVAVKGKAPKAVLTADQAIEVLTRHGFVPLDQSNRAGGVLRGFVKDDVIADIFVGNDGQLKGRVLLLSKQGNRQVSTGTDQLAELEALLAAG